MITDISRIRCDTSKIVQDQVNREARRKYVYIVTEYGGSYDDSWDYIIGVFTDKAKAEEVKETYWAKVQKRQKEVNEEVTKYDGVDVEDDDSPYWALISNQYDLEEVAGVKLEEYPLDEYLGGYYIG